jgi:hypothetical protein
MQTVHNILNETVFKKNTIEVLSQLGGGNIRLKSYRV